MRRCAAILLALAFAVPAFAYLTDAEALKLAKMLWGGLAMIASIRDTDDSNWTRQVGIKAPGCQVPFVVLGTGFNVWDLAFDDATIAHPPVISGPFKGTVTFQSTTWDSFGAKAVQPIVDGAPFGAKIVTPKPTPFLITFPVDTSKLADGLHVICVQVDKGSEVLASPAILFRTNQ